MRILLVALPRAGSKFLQININFWLKSAFGRSLDHPNAPVMGFGELLNPENFGQGGHLTTDGNGSLELVASSGDHRAERINRLEIFGAANSVVAKIMPYLHDPAENDEILRRSVGLADRAYFLDRPRMDQIASWLLGLRFNSWSPGEDQRMLIRRALEVGSNTAVDRSHLEDITRKMAAFDGTMDRCRDLPIKRIDFNDLIALEGPEIGRAHV